MINGWIGTGCAICLFGISAAIIAEMIERIIPRLNLRFSWKAFFKVYRDEMIITIILFTSAIWIINNL